MKIEVLLIVTVDGKNVPISRPSGEWDALGEWRYTALLKTSSLMGLEM